VADWVTISALATAGGTLVLAGATFSSVRSAHASTRVTERALLASIRPLLVPTRLEDPMEKIGFLDEHWIRAEGGRAVLEVTPEVIYMGFGLRNVGSGLAVLDRWDLHPVVDGDTPLHDTNEFRRLSRDLYIAGGDFGFMNATGTDGRSLQHRVREVERLAPVASQVEDKQRFACGVPRWCFARRQPPTNPC